ncbi:RNA-binding S4 domain-containing protein [Sphingobacterium bambusae]|uniref:RNA-binding S4 domain-containing protein n=1 Tax=Sphingobacterium bambusae TaxID=662858 RepID=A0ABW6BK61_9SPHI|nr:RNA-binding S4 domain-containing protein [Sphingobacterium bambusae]WPL50410.1 RNA-binding S4 domain-containing protein [Sphingobacterium bambusae]
MGAVTEKEKLRIDKYLWAIRIFKTRSLATEACKAGRIKLNGQNVKASAVVKIGDVYTIQKGPERKVVLVTGLLERRVDAKTAVQFYQDQTPVEETYAFKSVFQAPVLKRDRGTGRPTKKDRREIDDLKTDWWDDEEKE